MLSSIKTVLITGITGYLGSRLANEFLVAGYCVVGLKRTSSSLDQLKNICDNIELFNIDDDSISAVFKKYSIDYVIHAATCYGRSGESSLIVSRTNTDFPHELLIEAISHDVKVFINTGTTLDRYVNAYSLSKHHFVDWAKLLVKSADIRFVDMRLEHFYGPGDSDSKFVTAMIKRCLVNEDKIPLTSGEQKRDFIYIDDVISAYMAVISSLDKLTSSYQEFDVGSGQPVRIRDLVEMIKKYADSTSVLAFGDLDYRANEVMTSKPDLRKIRSLDWEPKIPLPEGLMKVIQSENIQ